MPSPPNSSLAKIVNRWPTVIATINGAGTYVHTLTATDACQLGMVWPPPIVPCFVVQLASVESEDGTYLGAFMRHALFEVVGYTQSATPTVSARALAAADLLDDLLQAVAADPTWGGFARRVQLDPGARAWGTPDGVTPHFGIVEAVVRISYQNAARV